MKKETQNPSMVIGFDDKSQLAIDLKTSIVSLQNHPNTQLRFHVCLNGFDGYAILQQLAMDPSMMIEVSLMSHPIINGADIWLNTNLCISTRSDRLNAYAILTPQQTGQVARLLPDESKKIFLDKVKRWYLESFLKRMEAGLVSITRQVENEDLLLADDHRNRVFDIHGGRFIKNIPYTEAEIAGQHLFWSVVHGGTMLEQGDDGYNRADALISGRRQRQKDTVDAFRVVVGKVL